MYRIPSRRPNRVRCNVQHGKIHGDEDVGIKDTQVEISAFRVNGVIWALKGDKLKWRRGIFYDTIIDIVAIGRIFSVVKFLANKKTYSLTSVRLYHCDFDSG